MISAAGFSRSERMICSARATPKRTRPGDSASARPSVKKVNKSPGFSTIGDAAGTTVSARTPSGRLVLSRTVASMPAPSRYPRWPGTGIDHRAIARVEPGHRQGDVMEIAGVGGQQAVGAGEDFADVGVHLRQGAQAGPRFRHQQGRPHAVAADVAQHDAEAAVEHGDVVEVVAGGRFGRKQRAGDLEARQAWATRPDRAAAGFPGRRETPRTCRASSLRRDAAGCARWRSGSSGPTCGRSPGL